MRKVPEVNQIFFLLMEDCLLNFHLHLNDFSLQVLIHFCLRLFNQLLNIMLFEYVLESFPMRNLEMTGDVIKVCLKQ
jgi:hypothetical protein